jgi:hypothetical protein
VCPNIDAGAFMWAEAKTMATAFGLIWRRSLSSPGQAGSGSRAGSIGSVSFSHPYRAGKRQRAGGERESSKKASRVAESSAAGSFFPSGARKNLGSSTRLFRPPQAAL